METMLWLTLKKSVVGQVQLPSNQYAYHNVTQLKYKNMLMYYSEVLIIRPLMVLVENGPNMEQVSGILEMKQVVLINWGGLNFWWSL